VPAARSNPVAVVTRRTIGGAIEGLETAANRDERLHTLLEQHLLGPTRTVVRRVTMRCRQYATGSSTISSPIEATAAQATASAMIAARRRAVRGRCPFLGGIHPYPHIQAYPPRLWRA